RTEKKEIATWQTETVPKLARMPTEFVSRTVPRFLQIVWLVRIPITRRQNVKNALRGACNGARKPGRSVSQRAKIERLFRVAPPLKAGWTGMNASPARSRPSA